MRSTVNLFNTALARLGGEQLSSLTSPLEESTLGQLCKNLFPHVLDMSLQTTTWGFALRTVVLPLVAGKHTEGSKYVFCYKVPADCVRPVEIETPHISNRSPAYIIQGDVEGSLLLCNESPAALVYVSRVTDSRQWPPSFADALAWGLAAELSTARNNDPQRQQFYMQMYRSALAEAAVRDRREINPHPPRSAWNDARFGDDIDCGGER
ncbi:MAG: hypothetical protein LBQ51_10710 [Desulfovibrio sp.]|jgi:hypothetical protein|nr:hypothetical protein [Desulfovibrio sp.]